MNERGQTTVLVLGMALLAFAVAGLAVDGTRAWLFRRALQNAADAAAVAGAGELDRAAYYDSGGRRIELEERAGARTALRWLATRPLDARAVVDATTARVSVELHGSVRTTFLSLAVSTASPSRCAPMRPPSPETPRNRGFRPPLPLFAGARPIGWRRSSDNLEEDGFEQSRARRIGSKRHR